tara:strand:+ start:2939 stop:3742 length:804 start_codon:yes stop_codon:yes gene_type:complete
VLLFKQQLVRFLFIVWFLVPANLFGQNPIKMAHSHNDYLNEKPLLSAIENNFKSIEVDVFLFNSELYVGHNWLQLRRNRTIEKLYLDHLWEIYNENNGSIYENNIPLYLLVDFKTVSDKTYRTLLTKLNKYKPMLTRVISDSLIQGAVTIITSGNKPSVDKFEKESNRIAFLDGRFSDIGMNTPNDIMPLISMSWSDHFQWKGFGKMPKKQSVVLDEIITAVHLEKKHIRFWATPDNKNAWTVLERAGVDLINTDKISEYSNYKISN